MLTKKSSRGIRKHDQEFASSFYILNNRTNVASLLQARWWREFRCASQFH
jgi:hypothetical protein